MNCTTDHMSSDLRDCVHIFFHSACKHTCQEIKNFREYYLNWLFFYGNIFEPITSYITHKAIVSLCIISNFLLLCTLFSSKLSWTPFAFLRIIVASQIIQGIFFLVNQGNLFPYIVDFVVTDVIVQSLMATKLFVCMLSIVLTIERFLAVCCVKIYSN